LAKGKNNDSCGYTSKEGNSPLPVFTELRRVISLNSAARIAQSQSLRKMKQKIKRKGVTHHLLRIAHMCLSGTVVTTVNNPINPSAAWLKLLKSRTN
jgi:predicted proteasome-type protease